MTLLHKGHHRVIEHRELRCTVHLPKYEQCPNAPAHVRKEALQRFATKRGVLSSTPIDEFGAPSNTHVVGDNDSDNDGVVCKKGKATRWFHDEAEMGVKLPLLRKGSHRWQSVGEEPTRSG